MQARTVAFTTVMLVHICYIFTARSITESAFKFSPFSNKWVLIGVAITLGLQLTIIYVFPSIGINPFRTAPLPAEWWITMILVSLPMFFITDNVSIKKQRALMDTITLDSRFPLVKPFFYIGTNPLKRTLRSIKTGIISRRPIHMFNISITFPMQDIPAFVIPVDNPTFPCAEATSNMTSPN